MRISRHTTADRRVHALRFAFLVAVALVCAHGVLPAPQAGQPAPVIWPGLQPGPHAVGFRLLQVYDHSRTFRPRVDYFGQASRGEISRPLQISIWYPARIRPGQTRMKYRRYYETLATETAFRTPSPAELDRLVAERAQILMMEWRVPPDRQPAVNAALEAVFASDTAAVADAEPEPGPFPLVVHMPGYNGSPIHHSALFEYLASRGFVVAAVPSMGVSSREIDDELRSIEVQARDMDFVVAAMRDLPFVDEGKIGATGMSWGGMSNVLFAERNARVDAVVTLDGAITMPAELGLIEKIPGYAHRKFRGAYLQLMTAPESAKFRPKDMRFYDALRYADAYTLQFAGVDHDEYSVDLLRLRNTSETDPARVASLEAFARTVMTYTGEFLDAFLNARPESRAFLDRAPAVNGVPAGMIVRSDSKQAKPYPPTTAEFIELVRRQGARAAAGVYRQAVDVDPELLLFTSADIGPVFMAAFDAGRDDEALEICRLWILGMPRQPGPYFSMARVYRRQGNMDEAARCYQKVLELVPEGRTAENARKALEDLKKKMPTTLSGRKVR